jgi:hypothetical protein
VFAFWDLVVVLAFGFVVVFGSVLVFAFFVGAFVFFVLDFVFVFWFRIDMSPLGASLFMALPTAESSRQRRGRLGCAISRNVDAPEQIRQVRLTAAIEHFLDYTFVLKLQI